MDDEIERILIDSHIKYKRSLDIAKDVAELISQGKIIGWFQGKLELGARALGNRSILADPRRKEISDYINSSIKHRELWRPFACSVIEEFCNDIFENYNLQDKHPFMIEAFKVKDNWVDKISAVIHKADNTSRPQSVNKNDYPLYYKLIDNFKDITGIPAILNTSFNDKGQPIIRTPQQAIDFFCENPLDVLAIGNFIVQK